MGGEKNPNWQRFINLCCDAYIILRRHNRMFVNLFAMVRLSMFLVLTYEQMLSTGMPELRTEDDITYLRNAFALDRTEAEARAWFEKLVYKSLASLMPRFNNAIHIAAHPKVSDVKTGE